MISHVCLTASAHPSLIIIPQQVSAQDIFEINREKVHVKSFFKCG